MRPEGVWAALDCPTSAPVANFADGPPIVLAQLTARLGCPVRVGEPHTILSWALERDGRKRHAAAALYDSEGRMLCASQALWIELRTKRAGRGCPGGRARQTAVPPSPWRLTSTPRTRNPRHRALMPCPPSERLQPSRIGSIVQVPNPMRARSGIKVPWASYTVRPSTRQAAVDLLRSSVISHVRSRLKSSSKSSYGDSITW